MVGILGMPQHSRGVRRMPDEPNLSQYQNKFATGQVSSGEFNFIVGARRIPVRLWRRTPTTSPVRFSSVSRDVLRKRPQKVKQFTFFPPTFYFILKSGCWESNPAYMHPMHTYCRYTTARFLFFVICYLLIVDCFSL